jgi:hypothetical protein
MAGPLLAPDFTVDNIDSISEIIKFQNFKIMLPEFDKLVLFKEVVVIFEFECPKCEAKEKRTRDFFLRSEFALYSQFFEILIQQQKCSFLMRRNTFKRRIFTWKIQSHSEMRHSDRTIDASNMIWQGRTFSSQRARQSGEAGRFGTRKDRNESENEGKFNCKISQKFYFVSF